MTEQTGPNSEFILYTSDDGQTHVQCRFEDETIWLSQRLLGELYGRSKKTISEHLQNLFDEGELSKGSVVRNFRTTADDGKQYDVQHYNLAAILAVGFRVKSPSGTQFRRWANSRLHEFLLKGFVMDDERLKNPPIAGASAVPDYFDEMLDRIRDIRSSERRVYLRVREIFSLASDYQPSGKDINRFFQTIQNKLHFAATGMTAAEIISQRADASKPNMGLTVWKGAIVRKGDVTTAKNYLSETEVDELNRIVVMWLDFAYDQARRRKQIFLTDWSIKLDEFLAFNDRAVLSHAGSMSKKQVDEKAIAQYDQFEARRRTHLETDGAVETIKSLEQIANKDSER